MSLINKEVEEVLARTFNKSLERLPTEDFLKQFICFDRRVCDWNRLKDENFERQLLTYRIREFYTEHSFIILNDEFITELAKYLSSYKMICELSCGAGWLTYWLRRYGCRIYKCVDNKSWHKNLKYLKEIVVEDSVECVLNGGEYEVFILSWPYMDDVAARIWRVMRKDQILVYIGEGDGGCCANDEFFELTQHNICDVKINNLSFDGIHDRVRVLKK